MTTFGKQVTGLFLRILLGMLLFTEFMDGNYKYYKNKNSNYSSKSKI